MLTRGLKMFLRRYTESGGTRTDSILVEEFADAAAEDVG
jgi:hypothetical protein